MFRKIHSNRDPRDTLYSEIRREFGSYLEKGSDRFGRYCADYPKVVFSTMLLLLLLSAALTFTVFRHPAPNGAAKKVFQKPAASQPSLNDGFSRILATGTALQQTLHLKTEVQTLLAKGKLTPADSSALERALDSLSLIHHQLNATP